MGAHGARAATPTTVDACDLADRRVREVLTGLLACDNVLDPARLRATAQVLGAAACVAESETATTAAGRADLVGPGGGGRPVVLRVVEREPAGFPPHPRPAAST